MYLLDTNILYGILKGDESIIEKIKLHADGKQFEFRLLTRIMMEFYNMKKFNNITDSNPIKVKHVKTILKKYGKVIEDDFSEKQIEVAKQFESKKYVNNKGVLLSMTDCMLLKYSLDNPHVVIVSHDRLLLNTIIEQNHSIRTFDPYLLQIN